MASRLRYAKSREVTERFGNCVIVGWLYFLLLILGPISVVAAGQDDFPEPTNTEPTADATRLSPHDAAQRLSMPAGFEVQVYAAEPEVQNPIALTWDGSGRLWVAENYTYADRTQRFDLSLRDRVLILEDQDGDGVCDRRKVFSDDLQMLTGVEVGWGGVWVMCPPRLLFIPDRDRDDQPDAPAEVVLDGFEVAQANYHNFANGLKFGPDGWLYGRCGGSCPGSIGRPCTPAAERYPLEGGIWRYHPRTRHYEVLAAGTTNPWGHDWNEQGELFFINTVNGHFWHLISGAHYLRPFTLDPNPAVYEMLDHHADHWHFDTGQSWNASRDGAANDYGGGHAHVGGMIYLGANWPQPYRGHFLTFNIHGRRANQEIIERRGSGFVAKHGQDLAISEDPWFRGMELTYGPDGSVYMADWSDAGECHEHTGVHRTSGRIYRVRWQGENESPSPLSSDAFDAYGADQTKLFDKVASSNEWHSRQARLELAYRAWSAEPKERARWISMLQARLDSAATVPQQLRYLWSLHALEGINDDQVRHLLHDPNESIRTWAIRFLSDNWPIDDVMSQLPVSPLRKADWGEQVRRWQPVLVELAEEDQSGLMLLTLASTLQRMPVEERVVLARELTQREEYAEDHNLPLIVWYGLMRAAHESPSLLLDIVRDCRWPKTRRFAARRLSEMLDSHPQLADELMNIVRFVETPSEQENLLQGIQQGLEGWRIAPEPSNWQDVVAAVDARGTSTSKTIVRSLSVLFGDGRAMEEVRGIVLDEDRDVNLRRSALEALVEHRPDDLQTFCRPLLRDPRLNMTAARGLAQIDDPEVADLLIESYRSFRAPNRPRVISILVSRESFAARLLYALESKQIAATEVSAFDVRQIHSLGSPELSRRVGELWGEVRDTDAEKTAKIEQLAALIRQSRAENQAVDLVAGRKLFKANCANCHRLFGDGEQVGPDLTGANRDSLDYLLQNIIDPSAVVSNDYRMSTIIIRDGRVLNGLVLAENPKTLTIQTQTERIVIDRNEVEDRKLTSQSPMPEGLIVPFSHQQLLDLMAYLQSASQVDSDAH